MELPALVYHALYFQSGQSGPGANDGRSGLLLFSLIINIIGLILGVFMILNPWAAWFSLSDLIGCYLLIVGIEGIVMALGCCQTGASDASVCHINTSQTKEK